MNSVPFSTPSTPKLFLIHNALKTAKKNVEMRVSLDGDTLMQKSIEVAELERGFPIDLGSDASAHTLHEIRVLLDDELCVHTFLRTGALKRGIEVRLQPIDPGKINANGTYTLALIELQIPGAVGPLPSPPADAGQTLLGINHGAALDNFPQHGLQLYIPAWQQMNTGDGVAVRLDGKTVQTETITALEVGQRVTTFVEARHLTQAPFKHTLEYIVTRLGQTPDPSAPTNILVELDRPGGQDQNGSIPGHSELTFSLPANIISDGVDAEAAEKGVPITIDPYPNMAELDVIKLSWGGRFITHTVTEAQVDQPVVLTATKEDILAAGDSGLNGLAVTYELYDVVDNRSEDWAAETRIVVDAGNSRLSSPFIKEAVNNVVDLDTLGTQPATAQIVAMSKSGVLSDEIKELEGQFQASTTPQSLGKETLKHLSTLAADFNPGDKIVVTMRGTTTEGTEVSYTAPEKIVDNLPFIYEVTILNAQVRKLAKTQAIFSYVVKHAAGGESKSRGAFISIVGEATRLPAPIAKDAAQGAIDPDLPSTRVEVPWDNTLVAGDMVTLKWLGTRPDTGIYDPAIEPWFISGGDVAAKKPLVFVVQGTHLKAIEGGTLQLYYLFEQEANGTILTRESNRTQTLAVGAPRNELPAPTVENVVDGVMDPDLGSTKMVVPNYPGKAKGDQIKTTWKGSASGILNNGMPVNDNNLADPIGFTVPGSAIKPNDQGTVDASYEVLRAETGSEEERKTSYSDINRFDVGEATLAPPIITKVSETGGDEIPEGATRVATNVTLQGSAAPGEQVEIRDGSASKGNAKADADGLWEKDLPGLSFTLHTLTAKALYQEGEVSAARTFTLTRGFVPTIDSLADSNGNLPQGGYTVDGTVTAKGKVNAGRQGNLRDNGQHRYIVKGNDANEWTATIDKLAVGPHVFKVTAMYSDEPESAEYTFNVVQAVDPTIASIKDSKGVEIPANATTFDTSVTVTGKASPNQTVDVLDGTTSKGKPKADASGNWTLTITGLSAAAHAIKAVAQYGSNPASAVRNFTVAAAVTPTIASIKDSKGVEIPANATTFDTSVTVTGKASPNQTVDVLDGTTSKGKPKADASGNWTLSITGLSVAAHAIKAVAQYGSNPASAVRNFTVAAAVTPTIASIKDSKGVEIPANATTFDTSVTVAGKASPNQTVDVLDGTTSKGKPKADASGNWTLSITGLSVAAHAIKAVAQYGSNPASAVRNFTVIAVKAVAITDVKDSKGTSIPDGGTTTDTSVTISGTVTYTS
ncbi:hypothetical protein [Pseudomonas sp. RC10]|uniref:hypothetical protein n=1 Tax=Pseudomonas bambusae TaxID=3139142 RepID=UPI0031395579